MSSIVVQKYGGSSVADAARIKRVAERIAATRRQGKQVCVVVSAMGNTTNELLARAREISPSPSRRELDMLLSCGERASMALVSMAVTELGYEAISFTGSQSGILTNDRHSGARIIEVRPIRVADELARGKVVIVAGFQGVSYKREITTLGRGGSDTTAVALAAALGAEYCEICSDVDGVYTADPRVVDAARLIEAISHDEMLELATHGARVLHADAVEFARRSDIALYARATAKDGGGTRIDGGDRRGDRRGDRAGSESDAQGQAGDGSRGGAGVVRIDRDIGADAERPVAGVTGQRGLVRVALPDAAAATRALEASARAALALFHVDLGADGGAMWLVLDDVPDWQSVRRALAAAIGAPAGPAGEPVGESMIGQGLGAVSAVGRGVGDSPSVLSGIRTAADRAGIRTLGLTTSPLRVTVFCADADVDALTRAVHAVVG